MYKLIGFQKLSKPRRLNTRMTPLQGQIGTRRGLHLHTNWLPSGNRGTSPKTACSGCGLGRGFQPRPRRHTRAPLPRPSQDWPVPDRRRAPGRTSPSGLRAPQPRPRQDSLGPEPMQPRSPRTSPRCTCRRGDRGATRRRLDRTRRGLPRGEQGQVPPANPGTRSRGETERGGAGREVGRGPKPFSCGVRVATRERASNGGAPVGAEARGRDGRGRLSARRGRGRGER